MFLPLPDILNSGLRSFLQVALTVGSFQFLLAVTNRGVMIGVARRGRRWIAGVGLF